MAGYVKQRKKIPITMRRVGKELPKLVPLDITFPLKGIHLEIPRDQTPVGSAIDTDGILLHLGALERMYGHSSFGSNLSGAVVMIANYLNSANVFETLVATPENLYKYTTNWTQIPKNPSGSMSGIETDPFWCTQIGGDLLFSQGVDSVYKYSGGSDFAVVDSNCPPAYTGVGHQGRLLLGYTVEGGIDYPYRVRWNVIDTIADWVGAGSGYIDLDDTSDVVTAIKILNDYPVVFKQSSIIVGNRTGQISPAYEFFGRDPLNGTKSPHAVVNLGDRLVYIGERDIFTFDLNKSVSIGEAIRSRFFDELNPAYRNQCIGYLVDELDEVRFCIPTENSEYNNNEWVWNRRNGTWLRRTRSLKTVGFYPSTTALTWDDMTSITWDQALIRWNSGSLQPSSISNIFGTQDGYVYKEDRSKRTYGELGFESFYEFGDIQIDPSKYTGVSSVEVRYRDVGVPCTLTVGLSNDGGKYWQNTTKALQTGSASGRILKTSFFKLISGNTVSLRIYNNSGSDHYEIVGIRLWLTAVGR